MTSSVFIMIAISHSNPRGSQTQDLVFNRVFAREGLIYMLIGVAPVYWMKRRAKVSTLA